MTDLQHHELSAAPTLSAGDERLLTPDEVATRWSVGKSQVWRLAREGQLPVVRIGRYVRFRAADLSEWERKGGAAKL
jgi:excisionase family DNA binding protein